MTSPTDHLTSPAVARHIKTVTELNFTIVAEPHEYHVDYTIYDIQGFGEGETKDVFDKPLWPRAGATS